MYAKITAREKKRKREIGKVETFRFRALFFSVSRFQVRCVTQFPLGENRENWENNAKLLRKLKRSIVLGAVAIRIEYVCGACALCSTARGGTTERDVI